MREDMDKVIVERPRWGSRRTNRKSGWSANSYDAGREYDAADRDLAPRRGDVQTKWFSDYLSPIRRFLYKQVGRPWRKVEGELRQAIDTRTVTGRHVMTHVDDFVAVHVRVEANGHVTRKGSRWPIRHLYVHPRTGLVCRVRPPKIDHAAARRRRIEQAVEVPFDADRIARKIAGIWYLVARHAHVEEGVVLNHDPRQGAPHRLRARRWVFDKKQASTEEIDLIREALERHVR